MPLFFERPAGRGSHHALYGVRPTHSCAGPGVWGTPQQAERDKLSPDSTKGWRAKGYPFPLLAKSTWISTSLFHWNRNADGQTVRCSLLKAKRSVMRLNNLPY